ncbi:MAG: hypothetical protein JRM80_00270 [Nitrososphaerota archaeon]|nr:hypothetical protein [Nitrososphaerota archaeon]
MSEEKERGPEIIETYRELVEHVEQGAGRIRSLSILTVVVASVLALSYISQIALPLAGTTSVTVNLTDPASVAAELVVLALALAWIYVGVQDLRFSWRMRDEIGSARLKEREIQERVS